MINIFEYWHAFRAWDDTHHDLVAFMFWVLTFFGLFFVRGILHIETRQEYRRENKVYTWKTGFSILCKGAFFYIYFPILGIYLSLKEIAKAIKAFKLGKEPPSWW